MYKESIHRQADVSGMEDYLECALEIDTEVGYMVVKMTIQPIQITHGHAEGIKNSYNPEENKIFREFRLLSYRIHNPTTVDQQGNERRI